MVTETDDSLARFAGQPDVSLASLDRCAARVPPYLLTGGRARPVDDSLEIEAQVITTLIGRHDLSRLNFETRDIVRLCEEPHAIVEVAARLSMHVGVARVLVGDLVATGHLTVRRPHLDLVMRNEVIERVIRGLHHLA
jgi:hypothetical protein